MTFAERIDVFGTLYVRCFGAFTYRGEGAWESGPTFKRGRELIEYFVAHPRSAASRETLADVFWPDADADAVNHRLHLAVSGARMALRSVLPAVDAIRCGGGAYAWNPSIRIETDQDAFFACYREGSLDALLRGVALYSGEYLAGENAEWIYPLRVRYYNAYVSMLERLAEDALENGDFSTAIEHGLRLVEADRGHEGATRLVMRAFAASGRRGAALAEHEALRRYLARHLCVSPSRATEELRARILADAV